MAQILVIAAVLSPIASSDLEAASHTSSNFVVTAPTAELARKIAELAELHRKAVAHRWLAEDLPDWARQCRITVHEEPDTGRGWTSYRISQRRVDELHIILHGRLERICETILPHEVTHAVLISWMQRPLPRWADEGVAMMSESASEQVRLRILAGEVYQSGQMLPLSRILNLVDYPADRHRLHAFYAGSFSLTEFLIAQGGSSTLLQFVTDGEKSGWDAAINRHYNYADSASLESAWRMWLSQKTDAATRVASSN